MEVIGADGVHVGTVDKVEGGRIKLTKRDSGEGSHKGHHHFIDKGLVAGVEGNKVRLSANADVAVDDGSGKMTFDQGADINGRKSNAGMPKLDRSSAPKGRF